MEEPEIYFDTYLNQSSYIKVVGVGGGGGNAVNYMFKKGIADVDFIVANTDKKALDASPVPVKLALGRDGLGVGGKPQKGRRAAEAKADEIKQLFEQNTKMIFITAGMGGGTGTGAAPVIARVAKEIKLQDCDEDDPDQILVVAVVTLPFEMEGTRRFQQAVEGIEELKKYTDSILVINNEKLRSYGDMGFFDAFFMANDVLFTAVKGIAEIITLNAYVNIDFCDVNTVMANSGTALMGVGEGEGENRAIQAIEQATTSVLLNDNDIRGAKDVLLYMSWSSENMITMDEMTAITKYLQDKTGGPDTNVIWGAGTDDTLGTKVKITLIATGFEQTGEMQPPKKHELPLDDPKSPLRPIAPADTKDVDPFIKPQPAPTAPAQPENHAEVHTQVTTAPAESTHAEVAPNPPVAPRVIQLEDVAPATPRGVVEPAKRMDDINIIARPAAEPVAEPTPTPVETAPARVEPTVVNVAPARVAVETRPQSRPTIADMAAASSFRTEAEARAARIMMIHNMLRNEEDGPSRVEQMDPMKVMGQPLYEAKPSDVSESAGSVAADGTVVGSLSLFSMPD